MHLTTVLPHTLNAQILFASAPLMSTQSLAPSSCSYLHLHPTQKRTRSVLLAPRGTFKTHTLKITIQCKKEQSRGSLGDSMCSLGVGYEYAHVYLCMGTSPQLCRFYTYITCHPSRPRNYLFPSYKCNKSGSERLNTLSKVAQHSQDLNSI